MSRTVIPPPRRRLTPALAAAFIRRSTVHATCCLLISSASPRAVSGVSVKEGRINLTIQESVDGLVVGNAHHSCRHLAVIQSCDPISDHVDCIFRWRIACAAGINHHLGRRLPRPWRAVLGVIPLLIVSTNKLNRFGVVNIDAGSPPKRQPQCLLIACTPGIGGSTFLGLV